MNYLFFLCVKLYKIYIMSNRKHSYHVICDCFYVSHSGKHLPIFQIGGIEVSFNGIIESDASMKETSVVLEYRTCRSRELRFVIPPFFRDRLLFKLTFFSRGRKSLRSSYVTYFPYRFIAE